MTKGVIIICVLRGVSSVHLILIYEAGTRLISLLFTMTHPLCESIDRGTGFHARAKGQRLLQST